MSVNGNGNVAALCEALELCKHELCEMCLRHNSGETCVNGCETIIRAKTALAANQPIYGQHPQSAPVGNSAAMRDALEYAIERAEEARAYLLRSADTKACMEELINKCRAALSAPPRNCDLYETEGAAHEAWKLDAYRGHKLFRHWLFTPANEKGENDGH